MKKTSETVLYEQQEMHCCGPCSVPWEVERPEILCGTLQLATHDGGGGHYVVLDAREWAMDSRAEVEELMAAILVLMPEEEP